MNEILFNNILVVNNYVYAIVPCTRDPYRGGEHREKSPLEAIHFLRKDFFFNKKSGWCSLNAEFFMMIMKSMDIPSKMFSYGIKGSLTHATALVTVDGEEYLMDPYFNRHYTYKEKPLPFKLMMKLINDGDTSEINSVYGTTLKYYYNGGDHTPGDEEEEKMFRELFQGDLNNYIRGKEFERRIVSCHISSKHLNEELMKHFGNTNIFNLMKENW
ncbi:MAG TPA: hypothetical protein VMY59_04230 [Candidatus Thermoplasmatota archaeon]|nr:hypothetical protein [Candidatus Thermoplasmatota archaeon]